MASFFADFYEIHNVIIIVMMMVIPTVPMMMMEMLTTALFSYLARHLLKRTTVQFYEEHCDYYHHWVGVEAKDPKTTRTVVTKQ